MKLPKPPRRLPPIQVPPGLTPLETYALAVDQRRRRVAAVATFIGGALLIAALYVFYVAGNEETCSTSLSLTVESSDNNTNGANLEFARACDDRGWPRGPLVLAGLGLMLTLPTVIGLLPPGSRMGIGSVQMEAGPGTVLGQTEENVQVTAAELSELAARRQEAATTSNTLASGPTIGSPGQAP